jgi:phenylalanyl-tRNA synthetase beta chain
MVSEKHVSAVTPIDDALSIANPLSPDGQYLRTSLLPNLLDAAQWNMHRGEKNLRVFEIGKTFHKSADALPAEQWELCALVTGSTGMKAHWQNREENSDYYVLKGLLQTLLTRLRLPEAELKPNIIQGIDASAATEIRMNNKRVGSLGRIDPGLSEVWEISQALWVFQMNLSVLLPMISNTMTFEPFPHYPAVKRDLAVIVKEDIHAGDLKALIRKYGGNYLESVEVFDLYRGKPLKNDEKSIAFSLLFRASDRTLKEKNVDPAIHKILAQMSKEFHATLRS